jgi:hypothetical protein
MGRKFRLVIGLVLAVASVNVVGVTGPPAVAAGGTGRIRFSPEVRLIDTRGSAPIAAGADVHLPSGLLVVGVLPTTSVPGDADVFPCTGQPDAQPTFRLERLAFESRAVVGGGDVAMCLRSSVPVHVFVEQRASVEATPFGGGLQYQPLPAPAVQLPTDVDSFLTELSFTLPRDGSIPDSAGGATYSVAYSTDAGLAISVHPCGAQVLTAWAGSAGDGVTIDSVSLSPGQHACVSTVGRGSIEVTLLGTLNTTGPDPTRLPPGTTSELVAVAPPGFEPIPPVRVFDTRTDGSGVLQPDEVLEVGLGEYITPSSTAVTMNVTATGAQASGFLTVWPCDEERPNASNLNFERGVDVPNLVTVRLSAAGTVCIAGSAPTHVLGDIAGTYEFAGGVGSTPMTPTRILDTRRGFGGQIVPANGTMTVQVAGLNGIPATGVQAVTMNVTATGSQGDGYTTVWPCDQPRPDVSNLNFRRGIDVANLVTVKLSAFGTVCFFSTATTHLLADVALWFSDTSTGGFVDLTPTRVLDTRVPIGQPTIAKLPAGGSISTRIAGVAGVPSTGAMSVTMNVTVANPASSGYLTVWPCGEPQPDASNLNFLAGVNVPNLVSVRLPPGGSICFFSTATTDVLADVAGFSTDELLQFWTVTIA